MVPKKPKLLKTFPLVSEAYFYLDSFGPLPFLSIGRHLDHFFSRVQGRDVQSRGKKWSGHPNKNKINKRSSLRGYRRVLLCFYFSPGDNRNKKKTKETRLLLNPEGSRSFILLFYFSRGSLVSGESTGLVSFFGSPRVIASRDQRKMTRWLDPPDTPWLTFIFLWDTTDRRDLSRGDRKMKGWARGNLFFLSLEVKWETIDMTHGIINQRSLMN